MKSDSVITAPIRLWSIQYLRAFAAVAVVLFHQLQAYRIFRAGSHGVDLFFVISGFIMVSLTDGKNISPKQFILDRIARIGPPYWFATTLVFLAVTLGYNFGGADSSPWLFLKSILFIPSHSSKGHGWPTLYLGWTLNYEMFFYVIFFTSLFFSRNIRILYITIVLIFSFSLGAIIKIHNPILSTYTNPLLSEFIAGAWIGAIFGISLHKYTSQRLVIYLALVVLAISLLALRFHDLVFGIMACVFVSTFLFIERSGKLPRVRFLKFLGDASFAIYLFQQFAFELVDSSARAIDAHTGSHFSGSLLVHLINVAAALALGVTTYLAFEKPVTRAVRRLLHRLTGESVHIAPDQQGDPHAADHLTPNAPATATS